MPGGRPTKYKPEYCTMLIEHMSSGLSFESFGANVDVCEDTLYEWAKVYPEFSEAKKIARIQCLKFWERIGIAGMSGKIKGFNAAIWIYNMKCRFRNDWLTDTTTDRDAREEVYVVKGIPKNDETSKTK